MFIVDIHDKKHLIKLYLNDQLTSEQLEQFETLLNAGNTSEVWQEVLSEIELDTFVGSQLEDQRKQALLARILADIKPQSHQISLPIWTRVAAILLLAIGMSWWFVRTLYILPEEDAISEVKRSNPKGRRATFYFPDGSLVTLNAASEVSYRENKLTNQREVVLKGEAYFNVAKDPKKPFIVKTGNVVSRVIGTEFNVKNHEGSVKVSLTGGSLRVILHGVSSDSITLKPGEMATVDSGTKDISKTLFDQREITAWTEGILLFKSATLDEVVETLQNWYGVKIEIQGHSDEEWSYTGQFKGQHLRGVLMSMSYSKNFTFSEKEDKVILMVGQ